MRSFCVLLFAFNKSKPCAIAGPPPSWRSGGIFPGPAQKLGRLTEVDRYGSARRRAGQRSRSEWLAPALERSAMTGQGVGARLRRKEDERFLRGRGQYVADLPSRRHARRRLRAQSGRSCTGCGRSASPNDIARRSSPQSDLAGVKPIVSAPPLKGFKRSGEPILAPARFATSARPSRCAWRARGRGRGHRQRGQGRIRRIAGGRRHAGGVRIRRAARS